MAAWMCLIIKAEAVMVTFSTTNKPATWAKIMASANGQAIESGATVAAGTTVDFAADEGVGFHIEWYVNGVKDESTT